ncbi:DNA helicase PIF1, ATP-dependent [Tanacetum coccineum]|uniref:ATP-dependent DNA helicase n=1 Tax=Tanacetum coccineum TaxID=301880 RepID=A0ABQ4YR21_9ASTR
MGSLLPTEGVPPRYAQLYFFDIQNEIRNRMSALMEKETTEKVDENTVSGLIQMLDRSNVLAQSFRMVKEWCRSHGSQDFSLRLISERTTSRQYNVLTMSEVAAMVVNDFGDGIPSRDIVGTTLLRGGRLFQQYLVDAFTSIEEQRLKWTRNNQDTLRVDLYHNLCDVVTRGDTSAAELGKRIVFPRSFICSPRYMMQNYKDAMALCRAYGNPDLFITFTSNPKWVEISDMLAHIPGQKSHDRPEIGTRVFKMKLTELMDNLTKRHVFGDFVYVIEFQKQGLPQAHILLWLEERFKCMTPDEINDIIAAELPSPTEDPDGYKVMYEFMLHGPCGKDAKYAPCTTEGKCSKHYPKVFLDETVIDEDGYPIYRRRNNKVTTKKGKFTYNNQHVVPYNRYLLLKYQAHINVEWCNRSNAIKYLFKYLNKGPDRAAIVIHENVTTGADGASLNYYLPNQNAVILHDFVDLSAFLEKEGINITMFTDWFELNKRDPAARGYTYVEIPQHYVWHAQHKIWRPRKQKKCIVRIVYSSPASGECYYLRMPLNVVRGTQSFEKLMMVNKQTYATFKAACFAYGLLNDNKECRSLQLWEENWTALLEDMLHKKGYSKEFQDLLRPNPQLLTNLDNRLIREALDFDVNKSRAKDAQLHSLLNPEQRMVYDKVIESTYSESGIASLLLLGGRTTHNRFVIPLELVENNTYGIKQNTHLAELMQQVKLVIWDEAPMTRRHCIVTPAWRPDSPQQICHPVRSGGEQHVRQYDESYLKERAIRTPRTDDADAINEFMFKKLGGASVTYHSADEICKASTDTEDQHHLYPVEFLNTLNFP